MRSDEHAGVRKTQQGSARLRCTGSPFARVARVSEHPPGRESSAGTVRKVALVSVTGVGSHLAPELVCCLRAPGGNETFRRVTASVVVRDCAGLFCGAPTTQDTTTK